MDQDTKRKEDVPQKSQPALPAVPRARGHMDSWVTDFLTARHDNDRSSPVGTLQGVRAGVLEVASYQAGPADADPVLLDGFPYDP